MANHIDIKVLGTFEIDDSDDEEIHAGPIQWRMPRLLFEVKPRKDIMKKSHDRQPQSEQARHSQQRGEPQYQQQHQLNPQHNQIMAQQGSILLQNYNRFVPPPNVPIQQQPVMQLIPQTMLQQLMQQQLMLQQPVLPQHYFNLPQVALALAQIPSTSGGFSPSPPQSGQPLFAPQIGQQTSNRDPRMARNNPEPSGSGVQMPATTYREHRNNAAGRSHQNNPNDRNRMRSSRWKPMETANKKPRLEKNSASSLGVSRAPPNAQPQTNGAPARAYEQHVRHQQPKSSTSKSERVAPVIQSVARSDFVSRQSQIAAATTEANLVTQAAFSTRNGIIQQPVAIAPTPQQPVAITQTLKQPVAFAPAPQEPATITKTPQQSQSAAATPDISAVVQQETESEAQQVIQTPPIVTELESTTDAPATQHAPMVMIPSSSSSSQQPFIPISADKIKVEKGLESVQAETSAEPQPPSETELPANLSQSVVVKDEIKQETEGDIETDSNRDSDADTCSGSGSPQRDGIDEDINAFVASTEAIQSIIQAANGQTTEKVKQEVNPEDEEAEDQAEIAQRMIRCRPINDLMGKKFHMLKNLI